MFSVVKKEDGAKTANHPLYAFAVAQRASENVREAPAERDRAGLQGEQRVVSAFADVGARLERSAALTNENVASNDFLTAIFLDAASLRIAVATVASRTLSLFVCHKINSCCQLHRPISRDDCIQSDLQKHPVPGKRFIVVACRNLVNVF